jgi:hypothetical protein
MAIDETPVGEDAELGAEATACPPDLSTVCTPCHQGKDRRVQMIPVHAHYQCPECGWRDSCCM